MSCISGKNKKMNLRIKLIVIGVLSSSIALLSCKKAEIGAYELSIMSFNLRYDEPEDGENQWDNRKEACVQMIKEQTPSIVGIQEGLYNQVNYLDEQLSNYTYVGVGRDDGYSGGEYAAIFYNSELYDTLSYGNFWLSETPDYPSLGWDANNIRIVTWAKFKAKGTDHTFFVFNTHFDHKGKEAQAKASQLLKDKISELTSCNDHVFITGDFNMLIGNKRLKPITDNFRSAQKKAKPSDRTDSFNGFGRWLFKRNIDFIFYQKNTPVGYKTIDSDYGVPFISDHYPIIAYFNY